MTPASPQIPLASRTPAEAPDARELRSAAGQLAGVGLDARNRLGHIVDAVADGVTVQGRDGRLVLANLAAARLAGYETPDELIAGAPGPVRQRFELFGEDHRPLAWQDLPGTEVLHGSPRTSKVVGFRDRATGAERWSWVTATPIRGEHGEIEFAVNAFHDITATKAAEDDLRRERAEAHSS